MHFVIAKINKIPFERKVFYCFFGFNANFYLHSVHSTERKIVSKKFYSALQRESQTCQISKLENCDTAEIFLKKMWDSIKNREICKLKAKE